MIQQCGSVAKRANVTLGCINKSIIGKIQKAIILLYLAVVRSQIEYCVQFQALHFRKDVNKDKLDRV